MALSIPAPLAATLSRINRGRRVAARGLDIAAWTTLLVAGAGLVIAHRQAGRDEARPSDRKVAKALKADAGEHGRGHARPGVDDRGRSAESPRAIPLSGWKDIFKRTLSEFKEDNLMLVAAGVTFYSLLALFPGIAAFAGLYGLVADVDDAQRQIQALAAVLPADVLKFLSEQMITAAAARPAGLSLTFAFGLLLALWSANGAIKSMILGLNIAYEEEEKRSFLRKTMISLAFTLGALAFVTVVVAMGLIVRWSAAHADARIAFALGLARWPILIAAVVGGVALLYRFGPSRDPVRWRWVSWGSAGVTVIWLAASVGFSFYLSRFGHYDRTYGQLSAVLAFLMWTYLSTVIILAGAEFNAETEHQTARDSTVGPRRPLGMRGAAMADSVGGARK